MVRLTPADERLSHQIPEPFPNVVTHHEHWRESYFFLMHPPEGRDGDLVILTMATYPAKELMDSYQMGRIGGEIVFALHERPFSGDPHTTAVGPVTIDIVEPFRTVRLRVEGEGAVPELDVTWRARSAPYATRRGTMKAGHEIIWDQSQMFQAGSYEGSYTHGGVRHSVDGWWGQRDHSWGIRHHERCPMWLWLAIQLPDGMIGAWHWELANGALVFSDGCFAPAGGGEPVPIVELSHDLEWLDADGAAVSYGRDGAEVRGMAGRLELLLSDGQRLGLTALGAWGMPYGGRGGGQHLCTFELDDGRVGNGVIELTGAHHHRYFPVARAEGLPE